MNPSTLAQEDTLTDRVVERKSPGTAARTGPELRIEVDQTAGPSDPFPFLPAV